MVVQGLIILTARCRPLLLIKHILIRCLLCGMNLTLRNEGTIVSLLKDNKPFFGPYSRPVGILHGKDYPCPDRFLSDDLTSTAAHFLLQFWLTVLLVVVNLYCYWCSHSTVLTFLDDRPSAYRRELKLTCRFQVCFTYSRISFSFRSSNCPTFGCMFFGLLQGFFSRHTRPSISWEW